MESHVLLPSGLLGFDGEKPELQESFKTIVLDHLITLVSLSSELTSDFVLEYYVAERLEFMHALGNDPRVHPRATLETLMMD